LLHRREHAVDEDLGVGEDQRCFEAVDEHSGNLGGVFVGRNIDERRSVSASS
jgi:hypothetical protein